MPFTFSLYLYRGTLLNEKYIYLSLFLRALKHLAVSSAKREEIELSLLFEAVFASQRTKWEQTKN